MSFYDILRPQIRNDEGEQVSAYQDSEGFWTIGVGHCIDKRKGCGLRPAEIALILENDLTDAEADARACVANFDALSDNRKAVLCNMAFNLGRDGLLGFKKFRKAIEAEDYETAAAEMGNSRWFTQVRGRGERLQKLMLEG